MWKSIWYSYKLHFCENIFICGQIPGLPFAEDYVYSSNFLICGSIFIVPLDITLLLIFAEDNAKSSNLPHYLQCFTQWEIGLLIPRIQKISLLASKLWIWESKIFLIWESEIVIFDENHAKIQRNFWAAVLKWPQNRYSVFVFFRWSAIATS